MIQSKIDCEIEIKETNDPRSYRLDSSKLLNTGFQPQFNIDCAIDEIITAFENRSLVDKNEWHTVKWMKHLNIK